MKIIVRTFAGFEEILADEVFQITKIKPKLEKEPYIYGGLEIYINSLFVVDLL